MHVVLSILGVAVLGFVLNVLIRQSYNVLFVLVARPVAWIICMLVLGLANFALGKCFGLRFSVVWWGAFLALLANISRAIQRADERKEIAELEDPVYSEWGITSGRLKYRLGLAAFAVGSLIGWLVMYTELVAP